MNRLIANHGEIEESRLLFLYGVTNSTRWHVLNSAKWVLIEKGGLTKNFDDSVLDELDQRWKSLKLQTDEASLKQQLQKMRDEFDRPAPKPGDIFEFGKSSGEFREIRF